MNEEIGDNTIRKNAKWYFVKFLLKGAKISDGDEYNFKANKPLH